MKTKNINNIQLVGKLRNESAEVKNSNGGMRSFREIMSFTLIRAELSAKELAKQIKLNFSDSDIKECKKLYY